MFPGAARRCGCGRPRSVPPCAMSPGTWALSYDTRGMEPKIETGPRLSLVIPAFNEEKLLPRLLETVELAKQRYRHGPDAAEVLVADNASTDRTAEVAAARGCRVVRVEERRIAAARNAGAWAASAPLLAFVDADSRLDPETFNAVERVMGSSDVIGGATGVRPERWSAGIAVTYAVFLPFILALRMDTGVVFCRRSDFELIGGYDERRYFGEDAQFQWDLKRLGRRRGQRLVRLTSVRAVASMRKFDALGDWHYFRSVFRLLPMMLRSPEGTNEFVEDYWYGGDR